MVYIKGKKWKIDLYFKFPSPHYQGKLKQQTWEHQRTVAMVCQYVIIRAWTEWKAVLNDLGMPK